MTRDSKMYKILAQKYQQIEASSVLLCYAKGK